MLLCYANCIQVLVAARGSWQLYWIRQETEHFVFVGVLLDCTGRVACSSQLGTGYNLQPVGVGRAQPLPFISGLPQLGLLLAKSLAPTPSSPLPY